MSRPRFHPSPLLLTAVLLVGGLNAAAYATNGHPVLVGHANHASRSTVVASDGSGPALRLHSRAGRPALSVTSRRTATGLNADRVDGFDSTQLGTRIYTYRLCCDNDESNLTKSFPGLPPGLYWVRYQYTTMSGEDGVSIWLDTGTSAKVLPTFAPSGRSGSAEGQVDAPHGVVMRLVAAGIFGTSYLDGRSSEISFIPLTESNYGVTTTVTP